MKKILVFLLILVSGKIFGQYPVPQTLGSDSTLVTSKGATKSRFVNWTFIDTTQANLQRIKSYPGAQIFTSSDNLFWLRNATATGWINAGGGGGSFYDSLLMASTTRLNDTAAAIRADIPKSGTTQFYDSTSFNFDSSKYIYFNGIIPVDSVSVKAGVNLGNTNLKQTGFNRTYNGNNGTLLFSNFNYLQFLGGTGNAGSIRLDAAAISINHNSAISINSPTINFPTLSQNNALTKVLVIDNSFAGTLRFRDVSSITTTETDPTVPSYVKGIPLGFSYQYLRGDLTLATFPTIPPAIDTLPLHNQILSNSSLIAGNTVAIGGKQNLITLTTTGSSGASTFNQGTGALNIPNYVGGSGSGWSLAGNSINAATDILGTTNNTSLRFVTNGVRRGQFDSVGIFKVNTAVVIGQNIYNPANQRSTQYASDGSYGANLELVTTDSVNCINCTAATADSTKAQGLEISAYRENSGGSFIHFKKARGNYKVPTGVQIGDILGGQAGWGYLNNLANFSGSVVGFHWVAKNAFVNGDYSTEQQYFTNNGAAGRRYVLYMRSNGDADFYDSGNAVWNALRAGVITANTALIGGGATNSVLNLRPTSGAGTTGADIIFGSGTNGAQENMRILNNGNVGIGTNNPTTIFDVVKSSNASNFIRFSNLTAGTASSASLFASSDGGSVTLTAQSSLFTTTSFLNIANSGKLISSTGLTGGMVVASAATGAPLIFGTNQVEVARFLSNGHFLIGTTTDISPLTVTGAAAISTSVTSPLFLGGSSTTSPITYQATSGVGAAGADHIFKVGNAGATEAMRILNSGNVGVGDNNPAVKFSVVTNQNSATVLQVKNNTVGTAATTGINVFNDVGTLQLTAFSSGFTTSGFNIANAAKINSSVSLTGGLVVTSLAGPLILGAAGAEALRIVSGGGFVVPATNTATGTTGAQTINKAAGSVNIAAAGTTLVVTNSLVTTSSLVFLQVYGTDATATSARVTVAAGSFTITLNAAATAETKVAFHVIN